MIISRSRNFIFVHSPKTGGTSVSHALAPLTRWCDIELGGTASGERINQEFRKRHGMHKHSRASFIRRAVGEEFWSKSFKFAFRRDPEERNRSIYRYLKAKRTYRAEQVPATYEAFLKWKPFTDGLGPDFMFRPQDYWLDEPLDFIGRTETLEADFNTICEKIGAPGLRIGRHNVTQGLADTVA